MFSFYLKTFFALRIFYVYIYPYGVYNIYKKITGGMGMKNIGGTDKVVRVILGIALLSLLFILNGNIRFIGLIGLIPLLTAFMGFCPLYLPFGINTNKKDK
jgi:hypothetical protein